MNTILIDIKKKHFKNRYTDTQNCPLALAIRDVAPTNCYVSVGVERLTIENNGYIVQPAYSPQKYWIDKIKSLWNKPETVIRSVVLTKM